MAGSKSDFLENVVLNYVFNSSSASKTITSGDYVRIAAGQMTITED